MNRSIKNVYFKWLYDIVCEERFSENVSYNKLLSFLHNVEFTYSIPNDEIRAEKGIDLRWKYCWENDIDYREAMRYLAGPCSVLEMMIALAISCEDIMGNFEFGDRTGQWFWSMISNLGLRSMFDSNFDEEKAIKNIERFLNREYEPNGKGGLFTVSQRFDNIDMRNIEIWHQLCWYLDSIYI